MLSKMLNNYYTNKDKNIPVANTLGECVHQSQPKTPLG